MKIRKATTEDMPRVWELVEELAIYEKEPEALVATVDDYIRDFEAGIFDVFLAEEEMQGVVGMALYYMTYSTWKGRMLYLEDFVVTQSHRRKGIGQLLFEAVCKEAQAQECRLLKWQVLDWNAPAVAFYEKIGADIEKNWWNGKLFFE